MSDQQNSQQNDGSMEAVSESTAPEVGTLTKKATRKTGSTSSSMDQRSRSVNVILQGKGGVGKTVAASLIAQWLKEAGLPAVLLDSDPVNASLAGIAALGAEAVDILDANQELNVCALDACVDRMLQEDANFVIDCGAASFIPLTRYLLQEQLIDVLVSGGKRVIIHTIVVGGAAMTDTLAGMAEICEQFPETAQIVVWINPHFGAVRKDGVDVEDMDGFKALTPRLAGIITLPALDERFTKPAVMAMLDARLTFAEARNGAGFTHMSRLRLANVWEPLKEQIAGVVA